ncbi:MAG: DUF4442 domain-containing protein [Bacteroidetes bacterium]|nr:DUF4442 domain-containing protein [Bacteroidota bacterium]
MQQNQSDPSVFNPEKPEIKKFLSDLHSPWKMKLYYFSKLPSLLFWRVQIKKVTPQKSSVSIPFSRRTKNPFRSIYFAAMAGASELTTGLLALLAIQGRGRISMLITGMEAEYMKKAVSKTTFTCIEGEKIINAVNQAIKTKEGQTIKVVSEGIQENGEVVARMKFTWSFKVKG